MAPGRVTFNYGNKQSQDADETVGGDEAPQKRRKVLQRYRDGGTMKLGHGLPSHNVENTTYIVRYVHRTSRVPMQEKMTAEGM